MLQVKVFIDVFQNLQGVWIVTVNTDGVSLNRNIFPVTVLIFACPLPLILICSRTLSGSVITALDSVLLTKLPSSL
jgi:fumarate reductase subunit D